VNGILRKPYALREGRLAVPDGPGLGVELDDAAVSLYRVE
jgi:L-alanine-DL-glutamate epimerase-like enolase superfamily enzyme